MTPHRIFLAVSVAMLTASFFACAGTQQPYHGFQDQSSLDAKDAYAIRESVSGALDPMTLAQSGQNYTHHGIAYSQLEEGYYQWGHKMYDMGYRDEYYVRD